MDFELKYKPRTCAQQLLQVHGIVQEGGQNKIYIGSRVRRVWSKCSADGRQELKTSLWQRLFFRYHLAQDALTNSKNISALAFLGEENEDAASQPHRDTVVDEEEKGGEVAFKCPICYNPITVCGETDQCEHHYCLSCLLRWSERSNRCPICRHEFTLVLKTTRKANVLFTPYWRLPVRCVVLLSDVRRFLSHDFPSIQFSNNALRYNPNLIALV